VGLSERSIKYSEAERGKVTFKRTKEEGEQIVGLTEDCKHGENCHGNTPIYIYYLK